MPKIKIFNARPGSSKFTTPNRAERYVRLGQAVLIGDELHFLTESEQIHMRNIMKRIVASERRGSDVYLGDHPIWWDGDDPGGMHKPGEIVS